MQIYAYMFMCMQIWVLVFLRSTFDWICEHGALIFWKYHSFFEAHFCFFPLVPHFLCFFVLIIVFTVRSFAWIADNLNICLWLRMKLKNSRFEGRCVAYWVSVESSWLATCCSILFRLFVFGWYLLNFDPWDSDCLQRRDFVILTARIWA